MYRTGRGKWTRSVNAATVKAANTDERSDDAEVYVNSGEFWIEKSADHYEWQVGEQVQYNVVVENKKAGTVARNVTVWDTGMPAGLALSSAEDVSVSGIPQNITQLTAGTKDVLNQLNPEFYNETSEKPVNYEFLQEGSGWRLNISESSGKYSGYDFFPLHSYGSDKWNGKH